MRDSLIFAVLITTAVIGPAQAFRLNSISASPLLRSGGSGVHVCKMTQLESYAASRRSFAINTFSGAAVILMSKSVFAEQTVSVQLKPRTTGDLGDLEAPAQEIPSDSSSSAKAVKELQKTQAPKVEDTSSKIPRWQRDLMKAQEKNRASKKAVRNRDDLCEVLGRGC